MKYRRALFVVERERDVRSPLAVLAHVAPGLERLLVVVPAMSPIEGLEQAARGIAASIEVQVAPELGAEALAALCEAQEIDLLVFSSRALLRTSTERRRFPVAVLWAQGEPTPEPIQHIGCIALDDRSIAAMAAFLRDHADGSLHVAFVTRRTPAPDVFSAALEVSGIEATVEISSLEDAESLAKWLNEWSRERPIDLLVFAGIPAALLLGGLRPVPVLLVPPASAPRTFGRHTLDVPDVVDDGGPMRLRIGHLGAMGSPADAPDEELSFVVKGRVVATVKASGGEAELPAGLEATTLGVYLAGEGAPADPVAAIDQWVSVVGRGERPLVLFDAELRTRTLGILPQAAGASALELLAVRLRPTRSCRAIRRRLRAAGLPPRVLDARAILDEGEALDVSDTLDPVRLVRVASRLAKAGFPVAAILHQGDLEPAVSGFVALRAADLEGRPGALAEAMTRSLAHRAGDAHASGATSAPIHGNHIALELDNTTARAWLLEAIESSRETLHLQVYMALDDDVGRPVEEALAAAGARGVTVRVLVDSVHGFHGSFGMRNPLLERLAARAGVELRSLGAITQLPSFTELKRRDHRKLVVADGRVALLGGRNLSHEYYTPFAEVPLTEKSPWRDVPWLDAGARVEGPAVAALSASFLDAWVEAGGAAFDIVTPPVSGSSSARVIVHHGLRDATTLEAYLELIDSAVEHVYTVNGFPLVLELQHALLRALRRGIRVRTLIGHLTPTHGGQPFEGPWSTARVTATELVHSRMDPIVAAGGEVHLFALQDLSGWAPGLGVVHPHVHAKVLSVDGRCCAVGSANLDVTASYWESEIMMVVEDAALSGAFEARIEALMASSTPVRRGDAAWQEQARRRAWMRHWPGKLSL